MFATFSFRTKESSECSRRRSEICGRILLIAALASGVFQRNVRADESVCLITNVAQFRSVSSEVFLGPCAFQLNGVVTWVDTNRDLLVLQDETGAMALNPAAGVCALNLHAGEEVSLTGSGCSPYVVGFPNFPYRPSGADVRSLFEAPGHWGEYYLTRMRGYLHPPVTGDYTFWIASDNSSELWLSSNNDPRKARRIASIPRYNWVGPREWSRFPSQRSDSIHLEAGQTYYIEADQEQTTGDDHLAVAWQTPTEKQSVIPGNCLTPWAENNATLPPATNGILREYWLDFPLGNLATITGARPFDAILSVENLQVTSHGTGDAPEPLSITLNQQLRPEERFNCVEAQGEVTFTGRDGHGDFLELSDDEAQLQVRVAESDPERLRRYRNATVRITGVCEGVYDQNGVLVPGIIWVAKEGDISLIETSKANASREQSSKISSANNNQGSTGFYNLRGAVTFNDCVFGNDIMFVQDETSAVLVSLKERNFGNRFEVGRWVEVGGGAQPGKNIPTLTPLSIMEFGWRAMPAPLVQPLKFPVSGSRDGRWTELEGVVHSLNHNGTLTLSAPGGLLSVWIGKATNGSLSRFVDAKLRLRGVLSLALQETPLLLVPSTSFVEVEKEPPGNPFASPLCLASNVFAADTDPALSHRVKLTGTITFSSHRSFFMQDGAAGVRVQSAEHGDWSLGQVVEVVGFPAAGEVHTLTDALVHPVGGVHEVLPRKLDGGEGVSFNHAGTLVQLNATLIGQHANLGNQVLELQEKQRLFEAELPAGQPDLPTFAPGSRLQLSGVCDFSQVAGVPVRAAGIESPSIGALKIWLRSPEDVVLLSGPPWWSWKYTTVLVSALLLVVMVSLLRIHMLRRRLERHLALSRQILESQESERHRIAANLHDSLGQNLLVIKNQARLAMQPAEETVLRQRLGEISNCASEAIAEVREITYALRPYQLDRLGLTQTIRATVNRAAENSPILFASHADDVDGVFDKESEIHVYRIVQEAVNNILKHSEATEAAVVVKKLASLVSLSIRDNGRGFDAATTQHSAADDVGHGLSGIKERVRILNGTFVIDSRTGHGTTLTIEIPILVSSHATS